MEADVAIRPTVPKAIGRPAEIGWSAAREAAIVARVRTFFGASTHAALAALTGDCASLRLGY